MVYLEVFADNPFASNCWLFAREGEEDAVVVDPGFHADRIAAMLREAGKRPVAVVATHGHVDHVAAAGDLCGADIPLYIHEGDMPLLAAAGARAAAFGVPASSSRPGDVRTLAGGEVLKLAGVDIEVIHTPGHTPGSICLRAPEVIFTGDLVFRGTIGRYDFPHSSPAQMFASLRRFMELPDDLTVYPGHGEATSVALERASNPFLRQLA